MFVLTWMIGFLSANSISADGGASSWGKQHCQETDYCVTFHDGNLTAEAGLCVVIPCSFTTKFTPKYIIWYKCEPFEKRGSKSKLIFNSEGNENVETGFNGRVSLLQPDVSHKNCSIMIKNLNESDSGLYQLRVVAKNNNDAFTYNDKTTLSVTALSQKPTVEIPPLTEGQQTKLTCTTPGLCSGSWPEITWTWRGKGEGNSQITENITEFHTENLTAATQRHSSTLTFNLSSEHHGTTITCEVRFASGTTRKKIQTLEVNYKKILQIIGNTTVQKGSDLNLTCRVESFPPAVVMWTKPSAHGAHLLNNAGSASLVLSNATAEDSGQYTCTATHLNQNETAQVDVTVTWFSKILNGSGCVLQSKVLTCVCLSEGVPLPTISWPLLKDLTEYSVITTVSNNTVNSTVSLTGGNHGNISVECFSSNGFAETKEKLMMTRVESIKDGFSKILNGSGCVLQSEVLTCVCLSEGVPLPAISWPLLKDHAVYSVTTTVSNNTVNSTVSLTGGNHGKISVDCVSSNKVAETKGKLMITRDESSEEVYQPKTLSFSWLQVIWAFLIGVFLSAIVFCSVLKCSRKKQQNSGYLKDNMEMIEQDYPLIHNGQAAQAGQFKFQEEAVNRVPSECNNGPNELLYASINYSLLNGRPGAAAKRRENADTVYSEVKTKRIEMENDGGDVMTEEDNEKKECVQAVEEGLEEAAYASVKDLTDGI